VTQAVVVTDPYPWFVLCVQMEESDGDGPIDTLDALEAAMVRPDGKPGNKMHRSLRETVLVRDGRLCRYCGAWAAVVDHVIPRSRGGRSNRANLAAACVPCDFVKADQTPTEAGLVMLPPLTKAERQARAA
jgi:hypothetical protein